MELYTHIISLHLGKWNRLVIFFLILKRCKENPWNPRGFFPLNIHIGLHFESSAEKSGKFQGGICRQIHARSWDILK